MFKIKLSPQIKSDSLTLEKLGDTLFINNIPYDLSLLNDGDSARYHPDSGEVETLQSVSRSGNDYTIQVIFPISQNASYEMRFPDDLTVIEDGLIQLPGAK